MTEYSFLEDESSYTTAEDCSGRKHASVLDFTGRGRAYTNKQAVEHKILVEYTHEKCESWINQAWKLREYRRDTMIKLRKVLKQSAKAVLDALTALIIAALIFVAIFAVGKSMSDLIQKSTQINPGWNFPDDFNSSLSLGTKYLNFTMRTKRLPLQLPKGTLKLHAPMTTETDNFIAYSQSLGRLNVVTYSMYPNFNAYFVMHPGIQNVVMVSDDLFCSRFQCFFINGADSLNQNIFDFIDLTHRLTRVDLPRGYYFKRADYCSFRDRSACPIVVGNELNYEVGKIAYIKRQGCCEIVVEVTDKIQKSKSDRAELQKYGMKRIVTGSFLILNSCHTNNLLLAFDRERGQSKIRIYGLQTNNDDRAYNTVDTMYINGTLNAITPIVDHRSLEICHLTRSQIECYFTDLDGVFVH